MSLRALFIGFKAELPRSCGHQPSQLRGVTWKGILPGWSRSCEPRPSQLRGPRELLELVLDKSFFHLELCLFLLSATSSSFWWLHGVLHLLFQLKFLILFPLSLFKLWMVVPPSANHDDCQPLLHSCSPLLTPLQIMNCWATNDVRNTSAQLLSRVLLAKWKW